jgi:hypothetical protein
MDDLTLNERVRLIEEFERNKPHSVRAAAKRGGHPARSGGSRVGPHHRRWGDHRLPAEREQATLQKGHR